jgi:hypothetical protein
LSSLKVYENVCYVESDKNNFTMSSNENKSDRKSLVKLVPHWEVIELIKNIEY